MNENEEAMIYVEEDVDVKVLADAYNNALLENDDYFEQCRASYDDRRNIWPGKSPDLRKNSDTAFPWKGASDQEVNTIGERIDTYVAMFDQALHRSHIKAFPTSMASMSRATVVSQFLKWMRSTYIYDFKNQMELGGNYLLEKGIMVSYVGWKREIRTFKQEVTMEQIAESSPEISDMIQMGDADDDIVVMLQSGMPGLSSQRAKTAIKELRDQGVTMLPTPRMSVDRPEVAACAPDGEVIFPAYVTDPQRSPYVFWRTFMTSQELEKKVASEGWDAAWVDDAIETLRGKDSEKLESEKQRSTRRAITDEKDLIMVLYGYQRLIDEEDGSEGIYLTVFHPDKEGHAHHELLNGYDDYPFVVTRLSNAEKRLYEAQTFSDILRGSQMQIKTERDSRIDRASMATLPPLMHPAGRPPSDWGPGKKVPYRRLGEIAFGPTPPNDSGSVEIESSQTMQADRAVGLDHEKPSAAIRQAFFIGKFLDHVRGVLDMAWKTFQRVGPDEVFFQVTGNPNPQTMTKGDPSEVYSITVQFDSQMNDPDIAETRLKQFSSLTQFDRNGRIDMDKLLEFTAMAIDPTFADYVLQPKEEAAEKMQKDVTDDLSKIYAGIEVPARPNGAQVAMQIVQAYAQQPDVAQRLQGDETFASRLTKYMEQYQFMMQQAQNAQIGKIGTQPADMGGMNTQGMQQ